MSERGKEKLQQGKRIRGDERRGGLSFKIRRSIIDLHGVDSIWIKQE